MGEFEYFAVAVPVLENQFVFEVRSSLVKQPGEVSFPGGKIETGEEPLSTAQRELEEELGIANARFLFELEPLVTPFNYVIFPYVFQLENLRMNINPAEVDKVFCAPIDLFLSPHHVSRVDVVLQPADDFPYEFIPEGRNYPWKRGCYRVMFFLYNEYVIWGLTARIAHEAAKRLVHSSNS